MARWWASSRSAVFSSARRLASRHRAQAVPSGPASATSTGRSSASWVRTRSARRRWRPEPGSRQERGDSSASSTRASSIRPVRSAHGPTPGLVGALRSPRRSRRRAPRHRRPRTRAGPRARARGRAHRWPARAGGGCAPPWRRRARPALPGGRLPTPSHPPTARPRPPALPPSGAGATLSVIQGSFRGVPRAPRTEAVRPRVPPVSQRAAAASSRRAPSAPGGAWASTPKAASMRGAPWKHPTARRGCERTRTRRDAGW